MTPAVVAIHLATVLPAALIGTALMAMRKGSNRHRLLGKTYLILMAFTGMWTLFMPSFSPLIGGHFGPLHALSLLTIWTVPTAWRAARRGNIRGHRSAMIQLYIGGILLAGGWAVFGPGRYLNQLLFN